MEVAFRWLVVLGVLTVATQAQARPAASCNLTDVLAAIAATSNGGTVDIPAGTCTWNAQLQITKGLALRGAGADKTIIVSGVNGPDGYLLTWNAAAPATFELSGLTIDGNNIIGGLDLNNGQAYSDTNAVPVAGVKIHDVTFTRCRQRAFNGRGAVYGVVYANTFLDNFIDIGSIGSETNGWSLPFAFGDANTLFVEDNVIKHTTDAARGQPLYHAQGGRMVFRYNRTEGYIDFDLWDFHGNGQPNPPNRGTVGGEMYRNVTTITPGTYDSWRGFFHRGGQAMVFNNVFTSTSGVGSAYFELTEEDVWKEFFGCPVSRPCPVTDKITNSFFWNNTMNGAEQPPFVSNPPSEQHVRLGSEYSTPAKGLASARPATCAGTQLYGTTDTDTLFKCVNGAWATLYRPYAYPHPLRGAVSPPPVPPVTPQPGTSCPPAPAGPLRVLNTATITVTWCAAQAARISGARVYGLPSSPALVQFTAAIGGPFGDGQIQFRGTLPPQPTGTYTLTIRALNTTAAGATQEGAASSPFALEVADPVPPVAPPPAPVNFYLQGPD